MHLNPFRSLLQRRRERCSDVGRRNALPSLEALESRDVPTIFANQVFAAALTQGLLGRAPTTAEVSTLSGALNGGTTPTQVASAIIATPEYQAREVGALYQIALNRPVDMAGLNYWGGLLESGASLNQVKAGILSSDEAFRQAGGTPNAFLSRLYNEVLGRSVDDAGQAIFGQAAASGQAGRQDVAQVVLNSPEAQRVQVGNIYREVLGRPADTLGMNIWTGVLQAGATDADVLAGILGSPEFFASVQNASLGGFDALQTASTFLTSNNLFVPGSGTLNAVQFPAFGTISFPSGIDFTGTGVGATGGNNATFLSTLGTGLANGTLTNGLGNGLGNGTLTNGLGNGNLTNGLGNGTGTLTNGLGNGTGTGTGTFPNGVGTGTGTGTGTFTNSVVSPLLTNLGVPNTTATGNGITTNTTGGNLTSGLNTGSLSSFGGGLSGGMFTNGMGPTQTLVSPLQTNLGVPNPVTNGNAFAPFTTGFTPAGTGVNSLTTTNLAPSLTPGIGSFGTGTNSIVVPGQ